MIFNRPKQLLRAFTFLLIATLLIAEYGAVEHAIEHSFGNADSVCFVCEKADNFQKTLFVAIGVFQCSGTPGYLLSFHFATRIAAFQSLFNPRAPPASISSSFL
ncbi:MAG: hypothetical protein ACU843_15210 [Gammaproteobacteria bacterium]